jgi:hypothetical protein
MNTHTCMRHLSVGMFRIINVQTRSLVVISKVGFVTCPTFFRRDEREKVVAG